MGQEEILVEKMQSACRLRQIRENAGLTQEQFAEVLRLSVSAYKKIESGENHVSFTTLRNLRTEMNVSTDFILYGKKQDSDEIWADILNCSETDKIYFLLRLLVYFTEVKKGVFPLERDNAEAKQEILQLLSKLQDSERDL